MVLSSAAPAMAGGVIATTESRAAAAVITGDPAGNVISGKCMVVIFFALGK
jgi:hypothetical protein